MELTAEDQAEQLALLEKLQRRHELKQKRGTDCDAKDHAELQSSSSEDTSDEKYIKLHSVEEARERALESRLSSFQSFC